MPPRPSRVALPLQMSLYFHQYWVAIFFVLNILIFIYKGAALPYPAASPVSVPVGLMFGYLILNPLRIFLASKGNKTDRAVPLVVSMLGTAVLIVFHVYLLRLQIYILPIDQVLNVIALVFTAFELAFSFFVLINSYRLQGV